MGMFPRRNSVAKLNCASARPAFKCPAMQVSESISCPYCGQGFELLIDTSVEAQRFTTDCEVCCRPFEVFAECEPGEVLALEVQGG